MYRRIVTQVYFSPDDISDTDLDPDRRTDDEMLICTFDSDETVKIDHPIDLDPYFNQKKWNEFMDEKINFMRGIIRKNNPTLMYYTPEHARWWLDRYAPESEIPPIAE